MPSNCPPILPCLTVQTDLLLPWACAMQRKPAVCYVWRVSVCMWQRQCLCVHVCANVCVRAVWMWGCECVHVTEAVFMCACVCECVCAYSMDVWVWVRACDRGSVFVCMCVRLCVRTVWMCGCECVHVTEAVFMCACVCDCVRVQYGCVGVSVLTVCVQYYCGGLSQFHSTVSEWI